jgi:hypothetical protein
VDPPLTAVQALIARVAHYIDARRWQELRALFDDEVEVDYTSLFGGTPQRQTGDALVGGWQTALSAVSTQHLLGPVDVEITGSSAAAGCHVRAWHVAKGAPRGEEWVVGGHYVFALSQRKGGWKITGMKLETFQQSGNTNLLQEASGAR